MMKCAVYQILSLVTLMLTTSWGQNQNISEFARLDFIPSGMTITPKGDYLLAVHPFCKPRGVFAKMSRVVKLGRDGSITPYPNESISKTETPGNVKLDSVFGMQSTYNHVVWFLDSGRFGETTPQLVGWNTKQNKIHKVISLPEPTTVSTSFLNDLAVDTESTFAYISDPAGGSNAAIIVVNLQTGHAKRVLQSHPEVQPKKGIELVVENRAASLKRPDGQTVTPMAAVNPIALDKDARYLYFGAMMGTDLFRIPTEILKKESVAEDTLARAIEHYAEKPVCDGISIDNKGNVYLADLANHRIGAIRATDRLFTPIVSDPRLSWPDGLCFGEEGKLNCYSSQLHRSSFYSPGKDATQPPYFLLKIKPLAGGTVGQ